MRTLQEKSLSPETIEHWPGKTVTDGVFHPAIWHMLDVGSVALQLLRTRSLTGDMRHDQAMALLITLHDIGKISSSFRAMLLEGRTQEWRHWQHSYRLLREHDGILHDRLGANEDVRSILYKAVAGHHGGPPEHPGFGKIRSQNKSIGDKAIKDSLDVISAVMDLFPKACLNEIDEREARRLSWLLSGLTVTSDWIGSNPEWFACQSADIPLPEYWAASTERAKDAIRQARLNRTHSSSGAFASILSDADSPRPMQAQVTEMRLPEGPMMALVEDMTGTGKTEAALILASRMMEADKAQGMFFALPTMATSNAMLERLENVVPRLFAGKPSLALTHGRARHEKRFRAILGRDGSDTDETSCGAWLADDRRRILMAEVGVGTIDQALMAVLPTRFNTLRLWALSGRILIIDEAHSYDPYMQAQLERLLRFQAMFGGSAIVMTATLPRAKRKGLIEAFQKGLHGSVESPCDESSYPQLTVIDQRGVESRQVVASPSACRHVKVERLGSSEKALAIIGRACVKGAACVWIRNAVDDAISAVEALQAAGIDAELLHARFALCDRLERERKLQSRFGRDGRGREGRVLVATQVVEQSLDLDFDVMISDLAPVGALIQRAGRLWRHADLRARADRPVEGPVLYVLSPDPDEVSDRNWLGRVLEKGQYVYPVDEQWRTARAIFSIGQIMEPEGLRRLIESVHGDIQDPLPSALEDIEQESLGKSRSERQLALCNLIDPHEDYAQPGMQSVFDDEEFPTRLGEPQITLALARYNGETLEPYAGERGLSGWALSEVQLARWRYERLSGIDQETPAIQAVRKEWPKGRKRHVLIAPVAESGEICEGLIYSDKYGLLLEAGGKEARA